MRRRGSRRGGFTLLEIIIAISLASMVFLAMMGISGSIIREHLDSVRDGQVSTMTLYSLDAMNREIESATHVDPTQFGHPASGDSIGFCEDYSADLATENGTGAIDSNVNNVKTVIYCVDGANTTPSGTWWQPGQIDANGNNLWRYELDKSCSFAALPAGICTSAATPTACVAPPGNTTWCGGKIIANNIWPADVPPASATPPPYFQASASGGNQITIEYIVGHSTPVTNIPVPAYFKGNFQIQLDRHVDMGTAWGGGGNTD